MTSRSATIHFDLGAECPNAASARSPTPMCRPSAKLSKSRIKRPGQRNKPKPTRKAGTWQKMHS